LQLAAASRPSGCLGPAPTSLQDGPGTLSPASNRRALQRIVRGGASVQSLERRVPPSIGPSRTGFGRDNPENPAGLLQDSSRGSGRRCFRSWKGFTSRKGFVREQATLTDNVRRIGELRNWGRSGSDPSGRPGV
jgi:hypothetical protein